MVPTIERLRERSQGLSLREQFNVLKRRWPVIFAVTAGAVALALVWLMTATPLYTGQTQLLIDLRKQNIVDESAILNDVTMDTSAIESEVSVIRSTNVARRVVEKFNLAADPAFGQNKGGLVSRILRFFSDDGGDDKPQNEDEAGLTRDELRAIRTLQRVSTARRVGLTYVVDVTVTTPDPAQAMALANGLAESYLVEQLEARYVAARRATNWLDERLDELKRAVEASEAAVAKFRADNNLLETAQGTITEQQISELNAQLVLARADTAEKRAKYEQAERLARGEGSVEASAGVLSSPTIISLRTQEADAARKLAELRTRLGPNHPEVVTLSAELSDVRGAIAREISRIVASIKNEYEVALERERSLEQSLANLSGGALVDDATGIKLRELEREASANRTLYENFLARFKEMSETTTLESSGTRVISPATMPGDPSSPQQLQTLIIALFLGLLAGAVTAVVLEFIQNGFVTAEQVEEELKLPVFALLTDIPAKEMPLLADRPDVGAYVEQKPLSRFAEGIRALRVGLQLSDPDKPPKVVMGTSSVPSEGKSALVNALAISAAQTGMKVLLIDADLRHPSTSRNYGLDNAPGLVDLLFDKIKAQDAVRHIAGKTLWVLPAGTRTKNPPDLLRSERMHQFLSMVRGQFDLVIIDTPPVTAVVDAIALANWVDKIFFVVEWMRTPRQVVRRAVSTMGDAGSKIVGVVLNRAKADRLKYYTYYYATYGKYSNKYYEN